jgi:hypothetical protein
MRSQIAGVVCALLTLTAARATAQPSSETTTRLSDRYSAWMNAFHARDGATMDRIEAPSFMLIFDGEIWTKDRPRVEALRVAPQSRSRSRWSRWSHAWRETWPS